MVAFSFGNGEQTRQQSRKDKILAYMRDGEWYTLPEVRDACGGTDSGNSAAIRSFRGDGYAVDKRRVGPGLWAYRVSRCCVGTPSNSNSGCTFIPPTTEQSISDLVEEVLR